MTTQKWKPVGPGGSMFRVTREDGRKAEVFFEPNGTWVAFIEKMPSPHAGIGETVRVGAFKSRGAAMLNATRWMP